MLGGVRIDLEVVCGVGGIRCRLQDLRAQRNDALVRDVEVLDPKVEMDLLLRCPPRANWAGRGRAQASERSRSISPRWRVTATLSQEEGKAGPKQNIRR